MTGGKNKLDMKNKEKKDIMRKRGDIMEEKCTRREGDKPEEK
jgi:hypothetical protein